MGQEDNSPIFISIAVDPNSPAGKVLGGKRTIVIQFGVADDEEALEKKEEEYFGKK